jgi:predicted phosphodiesterase
MNTRASRIGALIVSLCAVTCALVSCNVDLLGFFGSHSEPDGRFAESRSMPQPADVAPLANDFSFIFISDLHIEGGTHSYFHGLKDRLDGASFIVIGGDITQNGRKADVDRFIAEAGAMGVPVYATIGNHDLYSGGWDNSRAIGPSSFTVKVGNQARLVCLDTGNGTLGQAQTAWLEETLAGSAEGTVIVATHMHFFVNDCLETQQLTSPEETAALLSLYRQYGVDLALCGHLHKSEGRMIGSMRYAISPSFLDRSGDAGYLFVTCAGGVINVERRAY